MKKKIKSINVKYSADYGDRVYVQNYRKSDTWETGTVTDVEVSIRNGEARVQYTVGLDRRSAKDHYIRLYVGESGIDEI